VDKQALVVWIKVLEDMADTGDSVLCREFREVCNEVFASQGLPDMMANGPWVKPPPLSGGVEGPSLLRERIAQIAQGLIGSPAAPLSGNENARGAGVDLEADEGAAGSSAKPEELAPDRPARLSRPIWKTMTSKRRTGPRGRCEEFPWHQRAQTVLEDVLGGPLTVEDIIDFFADHDPSPVQITLLNKFIAEEGDPVEIMTRLLEELQASGQPAE
jgi:hypothetical protein